MKKLLGIGSAVAFAVASPAFAATLNWEGTASSKIAELPDLVATGGGVATVNGAGGLGHLDTLKLAASRGGVTGMDTVFVTDPETAGNGIVSVKIEFEPRTGTFGPVSGALSAPGPLTQNVLPIGGVAYVCLFDTICTDFLPLLLTQPTTNGARYQVNTATPNQLTPGSGQGKRIGVPGTGVKGIGIGGLVTVGGESPIRISVEAAPWTIKTATAVDQTDDNSGTAAFHDVTAMGFAHDPGSGTTNTATPSGVLQIVTPSQIRTNLSLGTSVKLSVITELLIHFIPEPGLLLLLGSGVVGLAVLGRSRMKS